MTQKTIKSTPGFRRATRAGVLATGFLMLSGVAHADDYSPFGITNALNNTDIPGGVHLQFIGSETGSWESNPLLLVGNNTKSLWGSVTTPELSFTDKTPTSQLNADVQLQENLFNQSTFDSTDLHGKFGAGEQMERWGAKAQIATDYDTTRTSELLPTGTGGSISNTPSRHLGLSFAPEVDYNPTQVDKIAMQGSLAVSQYDKNIFQNYATASFTPSITHNFDPLNAGIFQMTAQRFQSTSGPPVYVDTVGPSIGWLGTLRPDLSAKALVGIQTIRQYGSGAAQEPWTLQYTFSGDLTYKTQQDQMDFAFSRNDYPFGNGTETLLTTVGVTEIHNINSSFAVNVGASYETGSYQTKTAGNLDDLISANTGLTYHATERLDIAATYQYRRETLINTNGNATDNTATLGLVWRPRPWNL